MVTSTSQKKRNYIYKLTTQGLCSELNSLLVSYERLLDEDCRVFLDASGSQYFKSVSIFDIFKFPNYFPGPPCNGATVIPKNKWTREAPRHSTKLSPQQISELFLYTDSFKQKLNKNITKLSLPSKYNCFHIRRGDKVGERLYRWAEQKGMKGESKKYSFQNYFEKSNQLIETVFIMSDDYASVLESQKYNLNIKTLTTEEQTGHSTDLDTDNGRYYKEEELIQFFSEIEIAKQSQQFIGTKSSNIFRYIKSQCIKDVEFISLD